MAVLLAGGGAVGTVLDAHSLARGDAQKSRQAFTLASSQISSTLRLALQHEEDLVISAAAFVLENPSASSAKFTRWVRAVQAFKRYPELDGITSVVLVPASRLAAYAAHAQRHPASQLDPHDKFVVAPPGARPYYCFSQLAADRTVKLAPAAGLDWCAANPGLLGLRDTGQTQDESIRLPGLPNGLGIQSPLYRGDITPTTREARRHAFVGWIGIGLAPTTLLRVALQGHPNTAIVLIQSSGTGAYPLSFSAGHAPIHPQRATVNLHNDSSVEVLAPAVATGLFDNGNAIDTLIAGVVLSVLLGLLVVVLGTGRARALRLVQLKTRELASARDDAVEASNAKSVFVATVSHELRTPLSGVIGTAELLMDTQLDREQREYAEIMSSSSEGLLLVINDILDYSKIEAGKLELDQRSFALSEMVAESCALVLPIARQKGIRLEVEADPGLPGWLHGDAGRLRQVLINLLSNAVKFTTKGQVKVHVTASPNADASLVRVEVSDTGIGIDEPTLARLFQPFTQADNSTARKYGGTGLGLTISAQLIEMMGGTIGAHSALGEGSTFWFQVPLPLADQDAQTTHTPAKFSALGERDRRQPDGRSASGPRRRGQSCQPDARHAPARTVRLPLRDR